MKERNEVGGVPRGGGYGADYPVSTLVRGFRCPPSPGFTASIVQVHHRHLDQFPMNGFTDRPSFVWVHRVGVLHPTITDARLRAGVADLLRVDHYPGLQYGRVLVG